MMRTAFIAAIAGAAVLPASAFGADLTPAGPATITPEYGPHVGCPAVSLGRGVIVGWSVDVGEGGKAGIVTPRFGGVDGDPVELPAAPGTYTFPAPHIATDLNFCGPGPALVQTTGEHAIVSHDIDVPRHLVVARAGQADERIEDAKLALAAIAEPDVDGDLRGDRTEDRTDLRISSTPAREDDGRLRIEVTVTNAGPLSADRPVLTAPVLAGGRWEGSCTPIIRFPTCATPSLAAGETRVFVFRADAPEAVGATFTIASEGPDLVPLDNTSGAAFSAAPAFAVAAADRQRLSKGVKVQVRGVRAGRARVTAAFTVRGRVVKVGKIVTLKPYAARSVTLKAAGAKLRSLRRAASRGALDAEITVRTISGKTPVTAKTTVLR